MCARAQAQGVEKAPAATSPSATGVQVGLRVPTPQLVSQLVLLRVPGRAPGDCSAWPIPPGSAQEPSQLAGGVTVNGSSLSICHLPFVCSRADMDDMLQINACVPRAPVNDRCKH